MRMQRLVHVCAHTVSASAALLKCTEHSTLEALTVQTADAAPVVLLPLGYGSRASALNTTRSNYPAGQDLDLGVSARGKSLP